MIVKKTRQEEFEQRLENFAISVAELIRKLPKTSENRIYGHQVIRSSSSMGANYAEATCAHTKKDFTHDVNKSRKETKESRYWLRLIMRANPSRKNQIEPVLKECEEILKILSSIVKTAKQNQ